jgi:hypothetical protein
LNLPWRRWVLLAVTTLVIGYTVVLVFFTLFQRSLIYVPTRLTMAQPNTRLRTTDLSRDAINPAS